MTRARRDAILLGIAAFLSIAIALYAWSYLALRQKMFPPPLRESPPRPKVVSVAYLQFPPGADAAGKSQSWSRAPKAVALPDRFVLLAYGDSGDPMAVLGEPVAAPLVAGPDPLASEDEQLRQLDGELRMPDAMKWMVDFDRAVSETVGEPKRLC